MISIMKRRLMSGLVLVFMLFAVCTSGFAAAAAPVDDGTGEESKRKAPQLQVQLNGSIVEAPPYMRVINGQVMVPLRWSAELLGAASVEWDAAARTVTITTPQDFYNIEKFRSYAGALQPPIDIHNDKIWPLPEKVKDMQVSDLVSDRQWVLNLNQFNPEREGMTLPAPRDHITVNIISVDGVYQHSSVVNSIENHQGHYYLPMDWLEYLFNARVSYNEASNMLSIQTPDLEQIKSEIERIENTLIPDSADEAVKLWGRGEQTRNGALQYAALSPQLRQEADRSAYVRQSYWVTGCSSPQVGPITIESRNELSDTKIEYTITFPEIFSGQTHAIATEKMVVEKLLVNGSEGWFITQMLQSSGYGIIDNNASLAAEIIEQDDYLRALATAQKSVKTEEIVVDDKVSNEQTALSWMVAWFDMYKALPRDNMAHISDGEVDSLKITQVSKEGMPKAFIFSVTFSVKPTYPIGSNPFWMAGNTGNSPGRDETWGQMYREVELRHGDDGRYHFVSMGTGGAGNPVIYDMVDNVVKK